MLQISKSESSIYFLYGVWITFELFITLSSTPLKEITTHFEGESAAIGGGNAANESTQLNQQLHLATSAPTQSGISHSCAKMWLRRLMPKRSCRSSQQVH